MRQGAGEIFPKARPDLVGKGARRLQLARKRLVAIRQAERFKSCLTAACVRADKGELAKVGYQHQPVPAPIARDLLTHAKRVHFLVGRLDFHNATLGGLTLARPALLHLLRREQAEVGMPGPWSANSPTQNTLGLRIVPIALSRLASGP